MMPVGVFGRCEWPARRRRCSDAENEALKVNSADASCDRSVKVEGGVRVPLISILGFPMNPNNDHAVRIDANNPTARNGPIRRLEGGRCDGTVLMTLHKLQEERVHHPISLRKARSSGQAERTDVPKIEK